MKIYLSHSSNFDYQNELYRPLKEAFGNKHDMYFPHDSENNGKNSKDVIAACDVVLAEVSYPSTGQGIELGWADAAGKPIVCLYRSDVQPSGALRYVAKMMTSYDNEADMIEKLTNALI